MLAVRKDPFIPGLDLLVPDWTFRLRLEPLRDRLADVFVFGHEAREPTLVSVLVREHEACLAAGVCRSEPLARVLCTRGRHERGLNGCKR